MKVIEKIHDVNLSQDYFIAHVHILTLVVRSENLE